MPDTTLIPEAGALPRHSVTLGLVWSSLAIARSDVAKSAVTLHGAMESGKSGRLVKSLRFSGHGSCVGRRAGGLSKMAAPPKHPGFSMCGHAHATRLPARLCVRACPRHRGIAASKQAHHLHYSTNNLTTLD
jgi:hypothetical protein